LLTHGTATGRAEGERLLQEGDVQVWQPWDTPAVVQRFLTQFKPCVGILLETELWPNWVSQCNQASVPLVLVNARMSETSMHQAQRLAWLSYPAYQGLSAVLAQTQADADRLETLGAKVNTVLGNLKFDAQPDAADLAKGRAWRQN
jgi:3-deoxy-D-manno-octulosonic-acid transferase